MAKQEKRTELKVTAIENGTVIDHIPPQSVFQVINILGLNKVKNQIMVGTNLDSHKLGKKGIIKVSKNTLKVKRSIKLPWLHPQQP